jgi:hypothetical protein
MTPKERDELQDARATAEAVRLFVHEGILPPAALEEAEARLREVIRRTGTRWLAWAMIEVDPDGEVCVFERGTLEDDLPAWLEVTNPASFTTEPPHLAPAYCHCGREPAPHLVRLLVDGVPLCDECGRRLLPEHWRHIDVSRSDLARREFGDMIDREFGGEASGGGDDDDTKD